MKKKINITIDEDCLKIVDNFANTFYHSTNRSNMINMMIYHYKEYFDRLHEGYVWFAPDNFDNFREDQ